MLPSYTQKQPPEVFCKGVLRKSTKFTGKHLCQSLFFNNIAGLRLAPLLKMRLWYRCFPVNFSKFLRTSFLQNTSVPVTAIGRMVSGFGHHTPNFLISKVLSHIDWKFSVLLMDYQSFKTNTSYSSILCIMQYLKHCYLAKK